MGYRTILLERRDHIGIITFNRPEKLNAINLEMKNEIHDALLEFEGDRQVRVVIITGAGRAFSSGFDVGSPSSEFVDFVSLKEEKKLFELDKPTIAAIHGYVLGDGLQQALLCDMIVASDNAILGFIGPRIGGLCYGAFTILPAVVGRRKASELLLTCERISANEAYRIGLVNKVVTLERLMPTAIEMAEKIIKFSPLSIKYTKRGLRTALLNEAHKRALKEGWKEILASNSLGKV
ncbi:MAG TPA: enoyl-CoA hydratase/isomerase family protein [Deltaproteobacteria bacterium]|nr:enoyl-CoA hydratase/isomerase family protein [Deltaproteobacteria bacterium]